MMLFDVKGITMTSCIKNILCSCILFEKKIILPIPVTQETNQINAVGFNTYWKKVIRADTHKVDIAYNKKFTDIILNYKGRKIETTISVANDSEINKTFYYRAKTITSNQTFQHPNTIKVSTSKLDTPIIAYKTTHINTTGFRLSWKKMPAVEAYLIDISTNTQFKSFLPHFNDKVVTNDTTPTMDNLRLNKTYFYRIHSNEAQTPLQSRFDYTYDNKGNVIEIKNKNATSIRQYQYDDKLNPDATIHAGLCFFTTTNRDNWISDRFYFDENKVSVCLHGNNIQKKVINDITNEVFIFNYNSKDITTSPEQYYSTQYNMMGVVFKDY